ncbi:MAG: hypothetical protein D6780_04650, partial [Candidatus Dadabacteria bacterium]
MKNAEAESIEGIINNAVEAVRRERLEEAEKFFLQALDEDGLLFWRVLAPESFFSLVHIPDNSIREWGISFTKKLIEKSKEKGFWLKALKLQSQLTPSHFKSRFEYFKEIALSYFYCGLTEEGYAYLERALECELDPEVVRWYSTMAYRSGRNRSKAIDLVNKLVRQENVSPETLLLKADLLWEEGERDTAIYFYREGERLSKGYKNQWFCIFTRDELRQEWEKYRRLYGVPLHSPFDNSVSTIFLHLYRTGGRSVFSMLCPNYLPWEVRITMGEKLVSFNNELKDKRDWCNMIPFIHIHTPFGWKVPFKRERWRMFTVCRDPVKRAVSWYNNRLARRTANKGSYWLPPCIKEGKPFHTFIRWLVNTRHHNSFARSLCEIRYGEEQTNDLSSDTIKAVSYEMLNELWEVFIFEHFAPSMLASAALLGLNRLCYPRRTTDLDGAKGIISINDLSKEDKDLTARTYDIDMELYEVLLKR